MNQPEGLQQPEGLPPEGRGRQKDGCLHVRRQAGRAPSASDTRRLIARGRIPSSLMPHHAVVDLASDQVKFLKAWLAGGPDVAREFARLRGMHMAVPSPFDAPEDQAALEKAMQACAKKSAKPSAGSGGNGTKQQQQQKRGAAALQSAEAAAKRVDRVTCYKCSGVGHVASQCPTDTHKAGLRPPS